MHYLIVRQFYFSLNLHCSFYFLLMITGATSSHQYFLMFGNFNFRLINFFFRKVVLAYCINIIHFYLLYQALKWKPGQLIWPSVSHWACSKQSIEYMSSKEYILKTSEIFYSIMNFETGEWKTVLK